MIKKRVRNTFASQWAQKNNYSIHKAFLFRNKLNKLVKFGAQQTTLRDYDDELRFHFAIYYFYKGEWLLYGINDHWAFWTEDEAAEFANEHLIPYYELDKDFAKQHNVPTSALQLLRIKKQRIQ